MGRARRAAVPTRPTQAERRERSKRELVQAAIAITAEEGVSAATFQAIGARSGYHRSLVTQRFGARAGLVDAVLEYLGQRAGLEHEPSRSETLSGLEALLVMVDTYITDLAESHEKRAYFMMLSSAVAELDPIREAFATQNARVKTLLTSVIRRGQADGTIRKGVDAELAAMLIGSLEQGLSMQLLVDPATDLAPIKAAVLESLRRAFAA